MKNVIAKDLVSLHGLLNTDKDWSKRVKNIETILTVASEVKKGRNANFGYANTKPLIFQDLDFGKRVLPSVLDNKPKKVQDGELIDNIEAHLTINLQVIEKRLDIYDPLSSLNLSLVIEGEYIYNDEPGHVGQSWHLDKNVTNKDHKKSNFIHPEYHIHFGGDSMASHEKLNFGDLLLLESPRLVQLPLDLPLAVDFIIRNFYEKERNKDLVKSRLYREVLSNSQKMFWRPYFLSCAKHWLKKTNEDWSSIDGLRFDDALIPTRLNPYMC